MDKRKVSREDLRLLGRRKVLSTADLAQILGVEHDRAVQWARTLKTRGFLKSLARGLYATVPLEVDPRRFVADPYLAVDRAMAGEHAFSHWSALALLGAEHQVREVLHVVCPGSRSRSMRVGTVRVRVHSTSNEDWPRGTRMVKRVGEPLRVTTPERTALDLASLPNSQVEYGELSTAIADLRHKVDARAVLAELEHARRRTGPARLLHLLIRSPGHSLFSSSEIERLVKRYSLRGPGYMGTRPRNPSNRLDARWNVIYPRGE